MLVEACQDPKVSDVTFDAMVASYFASKKKAEEARLRLGAKEHVIDRKVHTLPGG